MILNFQAVENAHNFIPRERRPEGRRDFKRSDDRRGPKLRLVLLEGRRGPKPQGNRRGPREDRRSAPKINLKNDKAFPKL